MAVDACISPQIAKTLETAYSASGFKFISVEDLGGGEDEVWADSFRQFGGRLVLSGDANIGKRPHQAAAFIELGLTCYFPKSPFNHLRIFQQHAYILHNWRIISDHFQKHSSPGCWLLRTYAAKDPQNKIESVRLKVNTEIKQMTIPQKIIDEMKVAP